MKSEDSAPVHRPCLLIQNWRYILPILCFFSYWMINGDSLVGDGARINIPAFLIVWMWMLLQLHYNFCHSERLLRVCTWDYITLKGPRA